MDTPPPDLFTKIGPLPAWAWGGLAIVAYLAWSHFHSVAMPAADTSPGATATDSADVVQDPGTITSDPLSYPQSSQDAAYNYGDVLGGSYTGTATGVTFSSNQSWLVYCISFLTRQGYPPSTVTTALTHYLAGTPLTNAEQGIVTAALSLVGPPPLPLPIVPVSSPVPSATAPLSTPVVHGTADTTRRAVFTWQPITGSTGYIIRAKGVPVGGTFKGTRWSSSPQARGHTYGPVTVQAISNLRKSAVSAPVSVVIK